MAARKRSRIAPFPATIDRDYFGAWLSGFTDGEGHFGLVIVSPTPTKPQFRPRAHYQIGLRSDDRDALLLVQSYWNCGFVHDSVRTDRAHRVGYVSRYTANCLHDLKETVIPHFERYPLFAKKRRDFEVWREAVEIQHAVSLRRHRKAGYKTGFLPQWRPEEVDRFRDLMVLLREGRKYENPARCGPPAGPAGPARPEDPQMSLF